MTSFHSYPAAFQHIVDSMASLYAKKNADYGNSFADTWEKLGAVSGVTRISDKFNRLCNLLTSKNEQQVKDESIEDTLTDLACYSVMALIELKREKGEICITPDKR